MTERDSTKLLFLIEQYRPEPHAVKASDTEMTNLSFDNHLKLVLPFLFLKRTKGLHKLFENLISIHLFHTEPHCTGRVQ